MDCSSSSPFPAFTHPASQKSSGGMKSFGGRDRIKGRGLICRIFGKWLPRFTMSLRGFVFALLWLLLWASTCFIFNGFGGIVAKCVFEMTTSGNQRLLWAEEGKEGIYDHDSGALCLYAEGLLRKPTEQPFLSVQLSFLILQLHQSSPP